MISTIGKLLEKLNERMLLIEQYVLKNEELKNHSEKQMKEFNNKLIEKMFPRDDPDFDHLVDDR